MAKAKSTSPAHTPGPWVLRPNGEIKAQAWIGKWDDYICQMPFSSLEEAAEIGPSALPNAHLIAASPRLLDAAAAALDTLWAVVPFVPRGTSQAKLCRVAERRLRTALVEANGRDV